MELVDQMIRRMININYLEETKCVGENSREIENTGYKIWYTGIMRNRTRLGILVDNILKENFFPQKGKKKNVEDVKEFEMNYVNRTCIRRGDYQHR